MFEEFDTPDQSEGFTVTSSSPVTESDESNNTDRSPDGQNNPENPIHKIKQFLEENNDALTGAAASAGLIALTWNGIQQVRS